MTKDTGSPTYREPATPITITPPRRIEDLMRGNCVEANCELPARLDATREDALSRELNDGSRAIVKALLYIGDCIRSKRDFR